LVLSSKVAVTARVAVAPTRPDRVDDVPTVLAMARAVTAAWEAEMVMALVAAKPPNDAVTTTDPTAAGTRVRQRFLLPSLKQGALPSKEATTGLELL
jgi:hypothetical protein